MMANFKSRNTRSQKNFFSTKVFLALMGCCLVAISIFLWKTQESRNLSQLDLQTESSARSYSSETEIRYNGIYNTLNRLANKGVPDQAPDADEWGKDAAFFIDSFQGIKSIAWVDTSLFIRLIAPLQDNQVYLNQKANEVILDPSDFNLWVPVYKGTELEGFILGTINIDAFIAPVISDIGNDYMLQLSNEGKPVFTSANWKHPNEGYVDNQTVTLQNTVVLNLSFAPTDERLNSEIVNAKKSLVVSLLFSFLTIIAVYFAQNYNALATLNESRFRELLEDVELVAVIQDVTGRVTFCNDYVLALTGWKREEVLGQDWFARFVPFDWEQVKETFLTALPSGNIPAHYENPILTRTGEQRWLMFNNTILRDTSGSIIGTASLGEDITERKRAEKKLTQYAEHLEEMVAERTRELREAQEELVRQERLAMLGQVAGSIGHELRNPLGVISNAVYFLKMTQPNASAKVKEYLTIIENETRTSDKIVTDLLDFTHIKSLDRQPVAVSELLRQTLERYPVPALVETALEIPADLPQIYADPQHIIQVFVNLVSNACQAMVSTRLRQSTSGVPNGGKLTVSAAVQNDMIRIAVQDTGVGIPPENMRKLFEPLFTTKTKSIGLGLAVSRKLAEANGGRIEVESEPGKGSTFTVYLPVYRQENQ